MFVVIDDVAVVVVDGVVVADVAVAGVAVVANVVAFCYDDVVVV